VETPRKYFTDTGLFPSWKKLSEWQKCALAQGLILLAIAVALPSMKTSQMHSLSVLGLFESYCALGLLMCLTVDLYRGRGWAINTEYILLICATAWLFFDSLSGTSSHRPLVQIRDFSFLGLISCKFVSDRLGGGKAFGYLSGVFTLALMLLTAFIGVPYSPAHKSRVLPPEIGVTRSQPVRREIG